MAGASNGKLSGGEDGADGVGDDTELRRFSDEELLERSRRIQGELSGGIGRRLKDGGAKFRRLLDATLREIDRRKARATDDDKHARIVQSRCAESSVKQQAVTLSDFRSSFGIDEKAGIDVSRLEASASTGDPKTSIDNDGILCEEEDSCNCKPSTSQKVSYVDRSTDMKNIDADDDDKDNGYSRICKDVHTSQKRKGDFSPSFSMRLRSRKVVEEVVLLDGDTCISDSAEKTTSSACDSMKIHYPSWDTANFIELSHADIKCLEPESLLSSPILNFYIMYLMGQMPSTSRLGGKYHIFNTYFFSKLEALTSKVDKDAYFLNLRRWWKGVDIFQKAYIMFPVHAENNTSAAMKGEALCSFQWLHLVFHHLCRLLFPEKTSWIEASGRVEIDTKFLPNSCLYGRIQKYGSLLLTSWFSLHFLGLGASLGFSLPFHEETYAHSVCFPYFTVDPCRA